MVTHDLELFSLGFIAGFFFIEGWKRARFMLELSTVSVFLVLGFLIILFSLYKGCKKIRCSGAAFVGFGIGLNIRSQIAA